MTHRLAWVVQVRHVLTEHSRPALSTQATMTDSTVQWVIDAMTGREIMSRDFGSQM